MLAWALDPGLHMLGPALHSGLHNKVACVLVQHGVVYCFSTVVKATVFFEQFLISYMVIQVITYM